MDGFFSTFSALWAAPWSDFLVGAFGFAALFRLLLWVLFHRKVVKP